MPTNARCIQHICIVRCIAPSCEVVTLLSAPTQPYNSHRLPATTTSDIYRTMNN